MTKVRLEYGLITVEQPLPFNLFDEDGRLLLKHGYTFQDQDQLDRLIERGVFFDEVIDEAPLRQPAAESMHVYSLVGELACTFENLLDKKTPDYGDVLDIAGRIQQLCELDSDAALANILLQKAGRYSLRHSFHTAVMTEILLRSLDRPAEARRHAIAGALTMNACMLELQDELYSQNTPLTLDQKRAIIAHPQAGCSVLREQGIDHPVWLDVVENHHEMIDGSGYAKRLLKDDLSIESQGVSLADRYCAMVSERKHRAGLLPSIAAKDLLSRQSATIEPALAAAFIKEVGVYPPGTVVSLVNGEMAVVVQRLLNPEQPMVRSLRSSTGFRYSEPPKRITSGTVHAIKEVLSADKAEDFDLAILWQPVPLHAASDG